MIDEETRAKLNAEAHRSTERIARALGLGEAATPGLYYDRAGVPIGLGDWVCLFEDFDYRVVGHTMVGTHNVSTVWLGLNHGIDGPPLIFETMVFNEASDRTVTAFGIELPDTEWDLQDRYSTEADALAGHERIVAHVETLTGLVRS
jgi:hypothetical protein